MAAFALDTSCMVAAVCSWHEHHVVAAREITRRLERGEHLVACAPALVETFAVLTRLPAPYRLAPSAAWTLIHENFIKGRRLAVLSAAAYVHLLRELAMRGVGGGRTYDAVISACVQSARAGTLLTFNVRDFDPAPEGVSVIEP